MRPRRGVEQPRRGVEQPRRGVEQPRRGVEQPSGGSPDPGPHRPTGPGFGSSTRFGSSIPGGVGHDAPPPADQTVLRGDLPKTDRPGARDDQTVLRSDLGTSGDSPSTPHRGPDFATGAGASAAGSSTAWSKPTGGGHSGTPSPDLTAPAPNRGDVDTEDKTIDAASLGKARVDSDDPEKNPFAPRPEQKEKKSWKDRLPLVGKSEPEAPVGRRVAERKPWFRVPTRAGKKTDKRNITAALVTGAAVVLTIVVLASFFMWNGKRETAALVQSPTPTAKTTNDPAPLVTLSLIHI